ncbi:MAG TPA: glycosyltransferase family A protein [Mycobacteriales bacterium]|nr:glycosyltransferase family A protein [Mycobacteriales bacterium]
MSRPPAVAEMRTTPPLEAVASAAWAGPNPLLTVVMSTHGRADLLGGLLDALEAQDHRDFEVIIADNGSRDGTWSMLAERCARTPLRLRALRLSFHDGPAVPRNACIAEARGELIAFTDDDCLPTPSWLSALAAAFDDDKPAVIVQGRTSPEPGGWGGPWGRSLDVPAPSGLYETANLAARRAAIVEAGGFPAERLLTGRAFGEDVVLGSMLARSGGFRFAADAVVHHRVMPGTYRDFVRERQRLAGFPVLLRQVPDLRRRVFARVFLSRRTAITDLGLTGCLVGVVLAGLGVLPGLVALVGALPWLVALNRDARGRTGRNRVVRMAQVGFADLVGAGALAAGSLRARRLLL